MPDIDSLSMFRAAEPATESEVRDDPSPEDVSEAPDPGDPVDEGDAPEDAGESLGTVDRESDQEDTEAAAEPEEPGKPSRQVPIAALKAEREKRQVIERDLHEQKAKVDLIWKSMQEFMATSKSPQPAKPEGPTFPDKDQDPLGHMMAKLEYLENQNRELAGKASDYEKQQGEMTEQQEKASRAQATIALAEKNFRAESPDYDQALEFFRAKNRGMIEIQARLQGWDDAQIDQYYQQAEWRTALAVVERGGNPAEYAYNMARALGYVKPAADQDLPAKGKTQAEKAAEVQARSAKAQSLGSGGGTEADDSEPASKRSLAALDSALKERFGAWKQGRGRS